MVVESAVSFISMVLVTLDSTPPAEAEEPRKVVGLEDTFVSTMQESMGPFPSLVSGCCS